MDSLPTNVASRRASGSPLGVMRPESGPVHRLESSTRSCPAWEVPHMPNGAGDRETWRRAIGMYRAAFPDAHVYVRGVD